MLWRRFLSRRRLMRRIAELEDLSAAGRAIVASELDITALCALIAQEAGKVIDNQTLQVGLFDDSYYEIMYWTVNGRPQPTPIIIDLDAEPGIIDWMRESKQALLVQDFAKQHDALPAAPRTFSENPPRSAVFVPLISGERVLGVIAAQSQEANYFTEEDKRRLTILANQAGAAVANAQLFAEVQMRAAHMELVREIARQVNAVQELEEIFNQVVLLSQKMFGFSAVHIFSVNPGNGDIEMQASSGQTPANFRLQPGQGLVGTAVSSQQTVIANNVAEDHRFFTTDPHDPTKAEIAIPLIVNENVLGVLDVQSSRIGAFSASEQTVLEALAAEVGSAIHKTRQFAEQQERTWLTNAQFQVAAAISDSDDLETMAATITRLTAILVGSRMCALLLWHEETAEYRCAALFTEKERQSPLAQQRFIIGEWGALDAVHVGRESLATKNIPPIVRECLPRKGIHTMRLLPLTAKNETLGVLLVEERQDISASRRDRNLELLHNIADQTGRALENAYLRLAQEEEAWVNTALLQVAEAVNNRTDLNEILDTIVRLVPMLVGVESIVILVWQEAQQKFAVGPSHGINAMALGLLETLEILPGDMPAYINGMESAPARSSGYNLQSRPWLEKVLGTRHAYMIPLHARQRLVGLMLIGAHGRSLATRRLNILNGIAHQAATAVVNNKLYQEAAERDRLAEELRVAYQIQASLIPDGSPQIPGCSVASFWQAARTVSGDFYDFIPLRSGDWGIVIADVADKGVPAALFMALSRTILRTIALNRSDPGDVLARVNEIINAEARSDLFITVFYGVWQADSETLFYANAGHNPPMLLEGNGRFRKLDGGDLALGVLPGVQIKTHQIHLKPDDILLLYTDGVTEAINEDFDEFGIERMQLAAAGASGGDAQAIVNAITQSIRDHAGSAQQFDDITLVVLKRCP